MRSKKNLPDLGRTEENTRVDLKYGDSRLSLKGAGPVVIAIMAVIGLVVVAVWAINAFEKVAERSNPPPAVEQSR